jgi:hypothetical protein
MAPHLGSPLWPPGDEDRTRSSARTKGSNRGSGNPMGLWSPNDARGSRPWPERRSVFHGRGQTASWTVTRCLRASGSRIRQRVSRMGSRGGRNSRRRVRGRGLFRAARRPHRAAAPYQIPGRTALQGHGEVPDARHRPRHSPGQSVDLPRAAPREPEDRWHGLLQRAGRHLPGRPPHRLPPHPIQVTSGGAAGSTEY